MVPQGKSLNTYPGHGIKKIIFTSASVKLDSVTNFEISEINDEINSTTNYETNGVTWLN